MRALQQWPKLSAQPSVVDSHGVRLLPHYEKVVRGGRVNGKSHLEGGEVTPVAVEVNADNGFGHYASYRAI